MDTMADALQKVGLITDREKEAVVAEQSPSLYEQESRWRKLAGKHSGLANFVRLESSKSAGEFKDVAKKLLLEHPELTGKIMKEAHRLKNSPGGEKLVWLAYQVRDKLPQIPISEREKFLKRAFRRSGATVETE